MIDIYLILLLTIALVYMALFVVHLIIKTLKVEPIMRNYYVGVALFVIIFMAARIIFLVNDVVYLNSDDLLTYNILYLLGNFLAILATLMIMLVVEKNVYKKLHYVPSIIILICAIMIPIFPGPENAYVIFYAIISALMAALIPFLYIAVGLKVTGEPRTRSFILGTGLIIFIVAVLFYSDMMQEAIPALSYVSPIMMMGGIGLYHYGLLIYSKAK